MSADALPISPTRFAEALQDLPVSALHLKVLELRNSIAHLDYSNEQLRPYAEGTATALSSNPQQQPEPETAPERGEPDADCLDAIRENEEVIERMQERIRLVRAEVERRGLSWREFSEAGEDKTAGEDEAAEEGGGEGLVNGAGSDGNSAGGGGGARHSAWTDGTFQTGVIRDGQVYMNGPAAGQAPGGSLSDEELRRRVEEQLRALGGEDEEDGEAGLHL